MKSSDSGNERSFWRIGERFGERGNDMEVYYGKNYWYHKKEGTPLKKMTVQADIGKTSAAGKLLPAEKSLSDRDALVAWGKADLFVPAIYVGEEGVALDLCVRADRTDIQTFVRTYRAYAEEAEREGREISGEEIEQLEKLSPLYNEFDLELSLDGYTLKRGFMCGTSWMPSDLTGEMPEAEAEELMKEYGCSRGYGWGFHRWMFAWEERPVLKPVQAKIAFLARKEPVTVAHFATGGADSFQEAPVKAEFIHPLSGKKHMLSVHSFEAGEIDVGRGLNEVESRLGRDWEEMEYPSHYHTLAYTIRPSVPEKELTVQDCAEGDPPRRKGKEGIQDGPTAVFIGGKVAVMPVLMKEEGEDAPDVRTAVSSLHFEPVKQVEWRVMLHVKEHEDVRVTVRLL